MRAIVVLMSVFGLIFVTSPLSEPAGTEAVSQQDRIAVEQEQQQELEKLLAIVKSSRRPVKDANFEIEVGINPAIGEADAPIIIVEFADFQCRFCRRHMTETMPRLISDFIEPGQVRYVFFDYPLEVKHPFAREAAEAARCADDQGRYWEMRQYLFQNQKALQPVFLLEHARSISLDPGVFQDCLASDRHAAAVTDNLAQAMKLHIRGTPAFFIGFLAPESRHVRVIKRIDGSQPYAVFEEEIMSLFAGTP